MIQSTIVFQKTWDAIHKPCDTCGGTGSVVGVSCSWCGDGITIGTKGSGRFYKYVKLTGSSRSSKTYSLIDIVDLIARAYQYKRVTIWRDTKTDCKKTVLSDMLKRLKSTGRYKVGNDYNKTESIFTYTTDSTVEIHGTDDEVTVHGLTQYLAWLNEPYKISKDTFDQIDQRADIILLDLNPKMGHWSDDLEKDPRCIVIHSTFQDNPFCPPEQRAKILSYQPVSECRVVTEKSLTEEEANRYDLAANPLNFTPGRIKELSRCRENEFKKSADAYKWQVYGLGLKAEKPNRIFTWTEIPDSVYHALSTTIYQGVDWGAVDPWGVLEAKYYDGGLYLHEKNYASENDIRAKLTDSERAQIAGSDEGIVRWLFGKLGIPYDRMIICDNNRPLKILALREAGWEYAVAATKGTGSVIDGIDILNNIKVYFTSSSTNIKYEQENYSRKADRYGVVLEEPEDVDNHLMDPARYIATWLKQEGIIGNV